MKDQVGWLGIFLILQVFLLSGAGILRNVTPAEQSHSQSCACQSCPSEKACCCQPVNNPLQSLAGQAQCDKTPEKALVTPLSTATLLPAIIEIEMFDWQAVAFSLRSETCLERTLHPSLPPPRFL
jgi:hypothetical protein